VSAQVVLLFFVVSTDILINSFSVFSIYSLTLSTCVCSKVSSKVSSDNFNVINEDNDDDDDVVVKDLTAF